VKLGEDMRFIAGPPERQVHLYGHPGVKASTRPVVLMIHGVFGWSANLYGWTEIFGPEADVLFAALPGHPGGAPYASPSVEAVAESFLHALDLGFGSRRVIVVGESVGGVIALAMGASSAVARVVAVEPPLVTAKQWCFEAIVPTARERGSTVPDEVIWAFMGGGAPRRDLDHRPLLSRLAVPAEVIAGDVPLMPPRRVMEAPSFLDETDHAAILAAPMARLHIVKGGHALLRDPSDEVLSILRAAARAL